MRRRHPTTPEHIRRRVCWQLFCVVRALDLLVAVTPCLMRARSQERQEIPLRTLDAIRRFPLHPLPIRLPLYLPFAMALSLVVCSWHLPSLPAACFLACLLLSASDWPLDPVCRAKGMKPSPSSIPFPSHSLEWQLLLSMPPMPQAFYFHLPFLSSLLAFASYLRTSSSFSLQCSCRILRVASYLREFLKNGPKSSWFFLTLKQ